MAQAAWPLLGRLDCCSVDLVSGGRLVVACSCECLGGQMSQGTGKPWSTDVLFTYTHTLIQNRHRDTHSHIHLYTHVHKYVRSYVHACTPAHTHTRTNRHTHTVIHEHTYTHTHTHHIHVTYTPHTHTTRTYVNCT